MKSPKGLRIAQIILGGIAIALSGIIITNPVTTTWFFCNVCWHRNNYGWNFKNY